MNPEPDEIDFDDPDVDYWLEAELDVEAEERMTPEEREQDRLYRESLAEEFVDPFAEIERRSEALTAWERNG